MFEGFVARDIDVAGARIHLRQGGKGRRFSSCTATPSPT
jgi:hypothetical protein